MIPGIYIQHIVAAINFLDPTEGATTHILCHDWMWQYCNSDICTLLNLPVIAYVMYILAKIQKSRVCIPHFLYPALISWVRSGVELQAERIASDKNSCAYCECNWEMQEVLNEATWFQFHHIYLPICMPSFCKLWWTLTCSTFFVAKHWVYAK